MRCFACALLPLRSRCVRVCVCMCVCVCVCVCVCSAVGAGGRLLLPGYPLQPSMSLAPSLFNSLSLPLSLSPSLPLPLSLASFDALCLSRRHVLPRASRAEAQASHFSLSLSLPLPPACFHSSCPCLEASRALLPSLLLCRASPTAACALRLPTAPFSPLPILPHAAPPLGRRTRAPTPHPTSSAIAQGTTAAMLATAWPHTYTPAR